jgi:hypothetical protein
VGAARRVFGLVMFLLDLENTQGVVVWDARVLARDGFLGIAGKGSVGSGLWGTVGNGFCARVGTKNKELRAASRERVEW